jgi:hypothetical protein
VTAWITTLCGSCQAEVIWATTTRGRKMLVDAAAYEDGTIVLELQHGGLAPLARVLPVTKRFGRKDLRKSHFAMCPQAAQWRRRDGQATP